ncbi:MAG: DUF6677 family protein [Planctomycetota bacterium]|jgi:CDP-diglyceride synthetase
MRIAEDNTGSEADDRPGEDIPIRTAGARVFLCGARTALLRRPPIMSSHDRLSRTQRLTRLGMGVACVIGAFVVFSVSKDMDPDNRGALITIVMLIVGTGWIGQAARGQREGGTLRELSPLPGPAMSPERTLIGFVAAWLLPGAGHWILGQRQKAILYFATITVTFVIGIVLADGRNFNYQRDGVYFLAYMFNGIETLLAWVSTKHLERTAPIPRLQLGFLYSAVACLLNVVAMMDYIATCARIGRAPQATVSSSQGSSAPKDSA